MRSIDLRTLALIGVSALLGAAWAGFNLQRAGGSGATGTVEQLVWAVFATPFFSFWGWLLARRREVWRAALVCFCIYFFGIFASARIERLLLGASAAAESGHALYFRLTLAIQLIACLAAAAQRSATHDTIQLSAEPHL